MKRTALIILSVLLFGAVTHGQGVIDRDRLETVKTSFAAMPNGPQAYEALIREADRALALEITPVTEKTVLAASGDAHDYVSMGPYWWPDPGQPDGLPYIRRDGERNPESDRLDRTKMNTLVGTVRPLTLAWYFTGDERYAHKAVHNLRVWFLDEETRMNPHFEYAQMIPGHNGGRGRAAGLIDGYSFVTVTECIRLLESSPSLTPADREGLRDWFSRLVDWMTGSEIGVAEYKATNNHGLAYDVQLTAYALLAGREDVARRVAEEFPQVRLFAQVEPDGSQPHELGRTMAMHYSLYNIDHMLDMCLLSSRLGMDMYRVRSEDGRSIKGAVDFIRRWLGRAQAEFPYSEIGSWESNQQKLAWTLRYASMFDDDPEYSRLFAEYCTAPPSDIRWLLLGRP